LYLCPVLFIWPPVGCSTGMEWNESVSIPSGSATTSHSLWPFLAQTVHTRRPGPTYYSLLQ
jgi:hypothetical protein